MQLDLHRKWLKKGYSIGILSIRGNRICESVEDEDRGLKQTDGLESIKARKIKGQTAIPVGIYEIKDTYSPKYKKNVPLLLNVPGYEGIRIHPGNTAKDTEGCLVFGRNTEVGKVTNSTYWTRIVVSAIRDALKKGEKVTINIHH